MHWATSCHVLIQASRYLAETHQLFQDRVRRDLAATRVVQRGKGKGKGQGQKGKGDKGKGNGKGKGGEARPKRAATPAEPAE